MFLYNVAFVFVNMCPMMNSLIIGKTYIDSLKGLNSFDNKSDWKLSKTSGGFFPFVPENIAKSILKQRYVTCIKQNDDICIRDCESFRNYLYTDRTMPKSQQALFGDDLLIGLTVYNRNDTNRVTIQRVLPLHTVPIVYNISAMMDYVKTYHEPCE